MKEKAVRNIEKLEKLLRGVGEDYLWPFGKTSYRLPVNEDKGIYYTIKRV